MMEIHKEVEIVIKILKTINLLARIKYQMNFLNWIGNHSLIDALTKLFNKILKYRKISKS